MKPLSTFRRLAGMLGAVAALAMPLPPAIQALKPLPQAVAVIVALTIVADEAHAKDKTKEKKEKGSDEDKDKDKGKQKPVKTKSGKIDICHKAGKSGKFVDINVDTSASCAHLGYNANEDGSDAGGSCAQGHDGDYFGTCTTLDQAVDLQVVGCNGSYLTALLTAIREKAECNKIVEDPPDAGVYGGHFDLDTATAIYLDGGGTTNKHVHEWDDKNDLTRIDFFDIAGDGFDDIDTTFATSDLFIITTVNAALSTGGVLEINGVRHTVEDYEALVAKHVAGGDPLQVYMIGDPSADQLTAGIRKLTSLSLTFDVNAIISGGLIPTNTGCVKGNDFGPNGEYRNGALLVQALDASTGTMHATLHHATANLKWEASVFWHWDPSECYHDAAWQTTYDACLDDGSCLSATKHKKNYDSSVTSKVFVTTDADGDTGSYQDVYKIYMCHKAGNSGKYNLLNISKSAYCAHRGSGDVGKELDASGNPTGDDCVPGGHADDFYLGTVAAVDAAAGGAGSVTCTGQTLEDAETTYSTCTTELMNKIDACLDPAGGGVMGYAETGRISWKQIIDE